MAELPKYICFRCVLKTEGLTLKVAIELVEPEEVAEDLRTVRRGRWVKYEHCGGFWHECSICKADALLKRWGQLDEYLSPHCPNCGADMREVVPNEI